MLEKVAGTQRGCWGLSRRIFKQMEKEEKGCKGRYKRPGITGVDASDGKGSLSQKLWDCFPRVCGHGGRAWDGEPGEKRENWPASPWWADLGGFKSLVSRAELTDQTS